MAMKEQYQLVSAELDRQQMLLQGAAGAISVKRSASKYRQWCFLLPLHFCWDSKSQLPSSKALQTLLSVLVQLSLCCRR